MTNETEIEPLHLESPGAGIVIERAGARTFFLASGDAAVRIPIADLGDVANALRGESEAFAHQSPAGAARTGVLVRRTGAEARVLFASIGREFRTLASVAIPAEDADRLAWLIERWID